ncbi:MAG: fatty acyl-AMP ligase [Geminicoccaceae bacterium]
MSGTPTFNTALPFRMGGAATLVDGLDYAAQGETGFNFFGARGSVETVLPYAELRQRAQDLAVRLVGARLGRGERVGIIAETGPDFMVAFFGCQYAGLLPVPLPLCVNFGGREAYEARLAGMLEAAGACAAIGPADLRDSVTLAAARVGIGLVGTLDDFMAMAAGDGALRPLQAHEPCYIQYSSGSTSLPRGVLVSQQAVLANATAIGRDGVALRPGDRCTTWLPLYHDMGLVGCCITPMLAQLSVDYLATASFARRPLVWLRMLSEQGGTISFSPTFGYSLCARRAGETALPDLDLSRWRVAGIGAEMIRPQVLASFAERFAPVGFSSGAFLPSYGLAEATLAVTMSPLGRGIRSDMEAPGSAGFTLCGKPLPGYEIEIRSGDGEPMDDRSVGRIFVRGPSLMNGYFRFPHLSRAPLVREGWLDTGDLGYMIGGELVVTGRYKDLIIVGGRNIWPQDLEWAAEQVEGVRVGDTAAFAVPDEEGAERVMLVVECRRQDATDRDLLRREVAGQVRRSSGVDCEVILAAPRSLAYTTSGKLSRSAVRDALLAGRITDLDHGPVDLVPAVPPQLSAAPS